MSAESSARHADIVVPSVFGFRCKPRVKAPHARLVPHQRCGHASPVPIPAVRIGLSSVSGRNYTPVLRRRGISFPSIAKETNVDLTPERWQHVARIYELAVDQDPAARDAFLSEACAATRRCGARSSRCSAGCGVSSSSIGPSGQPRRHCSTMVSIFGSGDAPGPVPHRGRSRRRRHGRGLPRHRHPSQPPGRDQGAAGRRRTRSADARAVCPRSEGGCRADAPAHLHALRRRDVMSEVDFLVMEYLEGDTLAARLADGPTAVGTGARVCASRSPARSITRIATESSIAI